MSDSLVAQQALAQRLGVVAEALLPSPAEAQGPPAAQAANLLDRLVHELVRSPDPQRVWLLLTALAACLPTSDDVLDTVRLLELNGPSEASLQLLEHSMAVAASRGEPLAVMELAEHAVVADVDFSARHDLHTGIQRTVREVAPRWVKSTDVVFVAWTTRFGALRRLVENETDRVLRWDRRPQAAVAQRQTTPRLVVPWKSTVVLLEVPMREQAMRLASLAEHSGNRVIALGYDCIPIVSADLLPPAEADKFVDYLTVVKHSSRVIAISESAAREFAGFCAMLPTQGITGPDVVACTLPISIPAALSASAISGHEKTVVVVGSHEPRKNHVAVLNSARRLWREGHTFSLRLIGGKGWSTDEFDSILAELRRESRPVRVERSVGDAGLARAYSTARFSVFCSLHEGYGLPVAESLACGTPVLTSDVGSMAEIASGGGCLTVDPRDDDAITDGMRRLLTDDDLVTRLSKEAEGRPPRTWDTYAAELWTIVSEVPA